MPPQALFASKDGAAERLVHEGRFEQMIVDEVVGRIDALADLGKDHLLFAVEMLLVHVRGADEVGDELRQKRRVARQHPAVKRRLVA